MKINAYTLTARIFPAILSAIPFFVLHFYFLRPTLGQFWGEFLALKVTSGATILIVFLFLLMQVSRYFSKELFEKRIFAGGFYLPTTDYILHSDSHFSSEYTKRMHAKIKADFGIEIPPREEEFADPGRSRQIISEAVSHVRARVDGGKLTGQHNAEYGFIRNFAGGAVVGLAVCFINMAVFFALSRNGDAFWISWVLALLYVTLLAFSDRLITTFGHSYAKILIQEYMST
jgi:hypothetical protein